MLSRLDDHIDTCLGHIGHLITQRLRARDEPDVPDKTVRNLLDVNSPHADIFLVG